MQHLKLRVTVAALIVLFYLALVIFIGRSLSSTFDEPAHFVSGIAQLTGWGSRFYRVNPPLTRTLAAGVTVQRAPPLVNALASYGHQRGEFELANQYMAEHGIRAEHSIRDSRIAMIIPSFFGIITCGLYAWRCFGQNAGLVAMTLWAFCPVLLGHSALITPDLTAGAMGLVAFAVFDIWHEKTGIFRSFLLGAATSLALLSKLTWFVAPIIMLAMCFIPNQSGRDALQELKSRVTGFVLAMAIALFILNTAYLFDGTGDPLASYTFRSEALKDVSAQASGRNSVSTFVKTIRKIPIPLPRNYIIGFDEQQVDFEANRWNYLRGEWKKDGWYYYYVYGFIAKSTIPFLMLLTASGFLFLLNRESRAFPLREIILVTPPTIIVVLASIKIGMNHHLRYVLPALPFLIVFASRVALFSRVNVNSISAILVLILAWHVVEGVRVTPNQLSYFNQLVGGPINGGNHLLDSNLDWGQDLPQLSNFCKHEKITKLGFAYFGSVDPRMYVACAVPPPHGQEESAKLPTSVPVTLTPGWYAVSVTLLKGQRGASLGVPLAGSWPDRPRRNVYTYFNRFRPVARAGYSILIYRITAEDLANIAGREKHE